MRNASGLEPSTARANRGVRQIPLPPESRARSTLPRVEYTDCFLVSTDRVRELTAKQWARRMFEAAPPFWQRSLPLGWRTLGLDHGPAGAAEHILGWPIRQSTADYLVLGASGHRGISAELLFERRPEGLLFASLVHQHNWATKLEWASIAALHRQVVTHLLKHASNLLDG